VRGFSVTSDGIIDPSLIKHHHSAVKLRSTSANRQNFLSCMTVAASVTCLDVRRRNRWATVRCRSDTVINLDEIILCRVEWSVDMWRHNAPRCHVTSYVTLDACGLLVVVGAQCVKRAISVRTPAGQPVSQSRQSAYAAAGKLHLIARRSSVLQHLSCQSASAASVSRSRTTGRTKG